MVANNDPRVRSVSVRGCELRRVFRWRYLSRSSFLVPNVNGRYALGDQAVLALMPNPFPVIEQHSHCSSDIDGFFPVRFSVIIHSWHWHHRISKGPTTSIERPCRRRQRCSPAHRPACGRQQPAAQSSWPWDRSTPATLPRGARRLATARPPDAPADSLANAQRAIGAWRLGSAPATAFFAA
jgi:hypothetical protein